MKSDLVFVSYMHQNGSMARTVIKYPSSILDGSDIDRITEAVREKDPTSTSIVIINWKRFEDDGWPTGSLLGFKYRP